MLFRFAILILYCIICILLYKNLINKDKKNAKMPLNAFYIAIILAVGLRLFFAFRDYSFEYDISCFRAWSDYTTYGLKNLYNSDIFLDYPPGYIYVLYILRKLASLFRIPIESISYTAMLKLPAMASDFACAWLIYKVSKTHTNTNFARFFSAAFLLMPAVIFNSSIWGQIDSFYTFFLALALWLAYQNKTVLASISYAYALLVKPQSLLLGLIFLFFIIQKKSFKELLKATLSGGLTLYILIIPFCQNIFKLEWVVQLYKNTFAGYQYFTVNAYNIFYFFNLNWIELEKIKGAEMINIYIICLLVIIVGVMFLGSKNSSKFFTCAAFTMMYVFLFTTMMHERYIYPAIIFCFLVVAMTNSKMIFYVTLAVGATNYLNTAASMASYFDNYYIPQFNANFIAIVTLTAFVFLSYFAYKNLKKGAVFDFFKRYKESICVSVVTAVYAAFALFALGSSKAPETYFQSEKDNLSFDIVFDSQTSISKVMVFSGIGDEFFGETGKKITGEFDVYYSQDGTNFNHLCEIQNLNVFAWGETPCNVTAKAVRVVAKQSGQVLNEIIFLDGNNEVIQGQPINYNTNSWYSALLAVDESHDKPSDTGYYYSAYFDEIYHARTAYEQLNGYSIYETTHPPLGKIMISIGIMLFGMNPFGWRIVGVLCGIAMLPIIYLLAKAIFDKFFVSMFAMILLALDFMHLTQTRIATVDTYVVLFTMLTFLFMVYYHKTDYSDTKRQYLYLLISGFFMGCTVAVKWNGAYAMLGLAVFFFISLISKYTKSAKTDIERRRLVTTILFCFLAFVIVPLIIYTLSYLPVIKQSSNNGYFKQFFDAQVNMFDYHSNLQAEHFFASQWYTWPLNIKPIWYSVTHLTNGLVGTISAFGNPAVWILTPFAVMLSAYFAIKQKDITFMIVPLGYIFAYMPWMLITRLSFIYHYFPCVIFGILAIAWVANYCIDKKAETKKIFIAYMGLAAILFIVFFPVLTGLSMPKTYIEALEILPTWYFIN